MPDGDKILTEEQRAKLDGIVQQMIANKESDENIQFVVSDFKNKYGTEEPKKKESSEPFTGGGVGTKQESATPQSELGGGGVEVQADVEPITQVGTEFKTETEIKTGQQLPQNEYLREGVSYTKDEYDRLNELSQQTTAAENTIKTTEATPEAETLKMMGGESPVVQVAKQQLLVAQKQQEDIITTAKFRDNDNFFGFYDTVNFEPIAVGRGEMKAFVEDFYKEQFSNNPEFRDRAYDELKEDEKFVVNTAFANRYIDKGQVQNFLKSTGQDLDLSAAKNAGSQAAKSVLNTTASILQGADPSTVPVADGMNVIIVKARNGMITEAQYDKMVETQKSELLGNMDGGFYISKDKLPGIEPLNEFYDNQQGFKRYRYSEDQINAWIAKMPDYKTAVKSDDTPYAYEGGQLGQAADALNKWAQTFKTNPVYDESFWATKVPQGIGSSVPFIVSAIATRKLPRGVVTAITGGLANASQSYEQAIQGGATPEEANKAFMAGFGIGATEAVPIERMLSRFGGKGVQQKIIEGIKQGTEEGIQEAFQSISNDALAEILYDESGKVGDTAGTDASVGFVTGLLMGGSTALLSRGDITPEQKKIAEETITRIEDAVNEAEKPVEEVKEEVAETPVAEEIVEPVAQEEEVGRYETPLEEVTGIAPEEKVVELSTEVKEPVVEEQIIEPKIEQNEQDQKAEAEQAEEAVLEQPAEVNEVTPGVTAEKKSEALKKIEEAKAKLKAAQEAGVPVTNLNLGKADKTPILKSSALLKAAAKQARQVDKQKRHIKFINFVVDKNGKVHFIGDNPSQEIQERIDSGELMNESVKLVVNKKTLEPEELIRESKWKDKKRPKNKYEQLAAMAAKFQPVDLDEAIEAFLAFGGKVRGKDFTHYTGFKPGSEEYKKASWAFSDDRKTVPHDHLAEQKFKDFHKGEGKGENSVKIASMVMQAIANTSKGALLQELAVKAEDRLFAEEHEGMNRDEWEVFIKEQEEFDRGLREEEKAEIAEEEEQAVDEVGIPEELNERLEAVVAKYTKDGVTDYDAILTELEKDPWLQDQDLFNLDKDTDFKLSEILKQKQDEQNKNVTPGENIVAEKISPEEVEEKIGDEERRLNEKIVEAEKKLSDAKEELSAAEKKVLKDANKENDLFAGKEKKADEMFGVEVDVSKDNLNKILDPLRAKVATAERELSELQDPSQREAARKVDEGQGDLFDDIEAQKKKIQDLKNKRNNLGITDDENKARAELMAAYTDLAILYIKAGLKSAVDFAKEIGEELSEIIQEAWDNAMIQEQPTEQEPKEKKGRKKAIVGRAYRGTEDQKLRGELERVGLNYEPESWEEGKRKAREFVDAVGIDEALESVRRSLVVGAPAAYVWAEAIDKVHNEIAESTDPAEIEELTGYEAELLDEFGRRAKEGGQFISALQDVYANADFNYDLGKRLEDYRKANDGYIPPEVEAKMRDLDRKYKEALEREREAIKKMKELELVKAIADIRESIDRENEGGMGGISPAEVEELVRRGVESELDKMMARLSSVRKKAARKAIDALEKWDKSLSGMTFESTVGIPIAIVKGGIRVAIGTIKITGKAADGIEAGIKFIRDEYKKQFGKDISGEDENRVRNKYVEILEQEGVDTSSTKDKTVKEKNGKLRIPHALIRDFVERGITDPTELTQAILEIVRESVPDATERQVRDAISQYGRTVNQNQEEIEKEIRQIKNAMRDISAFEDIEQGVRPKKSGLQRDRPTAEERARKKKLREALKTLPPDLEADERNLRSTLDAIEQRLLNQIEDLNREIEKGEKAVREKRELPYTDRIKDLMAERDRVKAIHEEVFGRPELTDEQRIERAIKSVDKATANLEEQIRTGRLEGEQGRKLSSPELEAARKRLQDARTRLRELQEIAGIPEKKRLENAKKAGKRRIAELQDRIARKDFARKVKKPLVEDNELAQIRAEKAHIQEEFNKLQYQNDLKNRTKWQKFTDGLLEAWGITRALRATAEFSFMLIQGGFYAVSHPIQAARGLATALSHFMSQEKHEKFMDNLKADPIYQHIKEDKLAITEPDYKLNAREELFLNGWVNHIWDIIGLPARLISKQAYESWKRANLFKRFERANVGAMNMIRLQRYKDGIQLLEAQGKSRETHPQDYKNMAAMINTFTGRTSLGKLEQQSKMLSFFFFSPKMWASTLKTFTPYAFYEFGRMGSAELANMGEKKGDKVGKRQISVAQKMAMADYMKYVGLTTSMVALAALYYNNDDDDETEVVLDPKSSDFMKIKIGDTRVDPWGGRIQMIVLQARMIAGAMTSTQSKQTTPLGTPYKTPTRLGLIGQMTRNKLAPSMAIAVNVMDTYLNKQGEKVNKYGEPVELSEEITNNLYPIYGETLMELWADQPETVATFLTIYAFLGGGVQTYEKKAPKNKGGIIKPVKVKPVGIVKKEVVK